MKFPASDQEYVDTWCEKPERCYGRAWFDDRGFVW
jgi:hypothetical protein